MGEAFNVCWFGVYYCTRAFLPLLRPADEAHIVNISSVNGFRASINTAYSTPKFAVKGFTEALIRDLSLYAPHIKCSVGMPGRVGTDIITNSQKILRGSETVINVSVARRRFAARGLNVAEFSDDQIQARVVELAKNFRDHAHLNAADPATIILDGVKAERWRILVGKDAAYLDERVRAAPEEAYRPGFDESLRTASGLGDRRGSTAGWIAG